MKKEIVRDIEKNLKEALVLVAGIYAVIEEEAKKISAVITSREELIKKGEQKSGELEEKIKELGEKVKEQLELIEKLQENIQSKLKELSEKVSLKNPIITEEKAQKEVKEMA